MKSELLKKLWLYMVCFDTVLLFSNIWTGQLFSFEFITDAELHLRFTDSIFVKIHFIYNFCNCASSSRFIHVYDNEIFQVLQNKI